jgi:hypothetical protein
MAFSLTDRPAPYSTARGLNAIIALAVSPDWFPVIDLAAKVRSLTGADEPDYTMHTYGLVLLWILGVGFAAYAVWRLSEAAFGTAAEGAKAGLRVQSLVRGIVHATLCMSTFSYIAGTSRRGQSQQQV